MDFHFPDNSASADFERFGITRIRIEAVRLCDLSTDREYQRDPDDLAIERMAKDFTLAAAGAIVCVVRGEELLIVDGQHRVAAARLAGHTWIMAIVYEGPTRCQQARLWRMFNINRKNVGPLQKYTSGVVAKDPECIEIRDILKGFGLWVPRQHSRLDRRPPSRIECIGALRSCHRTNRLALVLDQITQNWDGDDPARFDSSFVNAVRLLLLRYDAHVYWRPQRWADRASKTDASTWLLAARRRAERAGPKLSGVEALIEAWVDLHNNGARAHMRLPHLHGLQAAAETVEKEED